jgi:DNA-binding winged helix-turn-helix (wHTH) protein
MSSNRPGVFGGSLGFHWEFQEVLVRLHFDAFTLDDGRRQLLQSGRAVHLSPKAYELLKVLLELRPRAIAKPDLHERLWPKTFVSEVNLAALIAELRAALGERGRQGRFIRTVHGFGYAFSFDAVTVEPEAAASDAAPPPVTAPPAAVTTWLSWGGRDFVLRQGAQTIGRDPAADVRIDAMSISRLHARLTCEGAAASVEDLGSKNGSSVNGRKVDGSTGLEDGDELRLGTVTLTFRNVEAPGSTITARSS